MQEVDYDKIIEGILDKYEEHIESENLDFQVEFDDEGLNLN